MSSVGDQQLKGSNTFCFEILSPDRQLLFPIGNFPKKAGRLSPISASLPAGEPLRSPWISNERLLLGHLRIGESAHLDRISSSRLCLTVVNSSGHGIPRDFFISAFFATELGSGCTLDFGACKSCINFR